MPDSDQTIKRKLGSGIESRRGPVRVGCGQQQIIHTRIGIIAKNRRKNHLAASRKFLAISRYRLCEKG